jgi:hypothetical protein
MWVGFFIFVGMPLLVGILTKDPDAGRRLLFLELFLIFAFIFGISLWNNL